MKQIITSVFGAFLLLTHTTASAQQAYSVSSVPEDPLPVTNPVTDKTYCPGVATSIISLSGTPANTSFTWSNNNTSIGLGTNGTGNIPVFTPVNQGTQPATATITLQPSVTGLVSTTETFNYSGSVTSFTVPAGVSSITLTAKGAQGGNVTLDGPAAGGYGAVITATYTVIPGHVLNILVGQQPTSAFFTGGGGGGTFVWDVTAGNTLLVAAGGGGGAASTQGCFCSENGASASLTTSGTGGTGGLGGAGIGGNGGSALSGATYNVYGGGGAGWLSNGVAPLSSGTCPQIGTVSYTALTGGAGGNNAGGPWGNSYNGNGGYGGGGGSMGYCGGYGGGGGGGGYSGGAGGNLDTTPRHAYGGGGGGSYSIGNISLTTANHTGSGQVIINYISEGTIAGLPTSFSIVVNPEPTVNAIPNETVCNQQQTTAITFTGNTTGNSVTYNWTNSDTSIGLGASGSGDIASFVAKNKTNAPKTATITVTPGYTNAGTTCTGTPITFDITVNPTPVLDFINNQVVCNEGNTNAVNFNSTATGGILMYNWTNSAPSINQPVAGTGNIASFNSINTSNAPTTAIFTATPSFTNNLVTCMGSSRTFSITTLPTVTVNPLTDLTVCSNTETDTIPFSSDQTGGEITYAWENNNPSIGLAASGSGALPSFAAINGSNAPLTATITVTPTITSTLSANLFLLPGWAYSEALTAVEHSGDTLTGYQLKMNINTQTLISNGQLKADGSDLRFGYNSGAVLYHYWIESGLNTDSTTVWVRIDSIPASGTKTFYMYYGNPAATGVSAIPGTFDGVNSATDSVSSGGAGGVTNSQRGFRFSAKEDVLVASFGKREPNGSNRIITLFDFNTQQILRQQTITGPAGQYSYQDITQPIWLVPGKEYLLEMYQGDSDGYYFGTSSQIGEHLTYLDMRYCNQCTPNTFPTNILTNYQYGYPDLGYYTRQHINQPPTYVQGPGVSCTGTPETFTITVNPKPVANGIDNQVLCNNTLSEPVAFSSPATGGTVTYSWTNNDTTIGLTSGGTGNIPAFTAVNNGLAPVTATITATPSFENNGVTCTGDPVSFTITVNPAPAANDISNQTVCNQGTTSNIAFSSTATGGDLTYSWTNNNPSIGLAANGTGDIAAFTAINNGNIPAIATVEVTPYFTQTGITCTGTAETFTITVNPKPTVTAIGNQTVCNNAWSLPVNFSSATTGGTLIYNWTNSDTTIGLASGGTGNIAAFTAVNNGLAPVTATITATPSFENNGVTCTGDPVSFTITVNPMAVMDTIASQTICNQEATTTISFSSGNTGGTTTYSWTNSHPSIGLAANGSGNSIPSFTAVNTSQAAIIATISITPSFTNGGITCVGVPTTTTITVNPTPVLITHDTSIQSNGLVNLTAAGFTAGSDPGLTFGYWTNASATAAVPDPTAVPTGTYYITAQNNNGCRDTASVLVSIIPLRNISGKVHNDIDGLNGSPSNTINGSGTNAGNLRAVLVANTNDSVINVQNVAGNGDFFFNGIKDGSYRIIITTATVAGYTLPAMTLAQGWVHTGEFYGAGAGNDGSPDGVLNLGTINSNVNNARFGIEQPPVASNSSSNAQLNPGSNTSVTVNGNAFACSDPSPGAVRQIRFTGFPANATSANIGFNSYTAANWPAQGVTVTTIGNQPLLPISIDPASGPVTVTMPYVAIDAAGFSSNIATVSVPFTGITLSGIVHNDIDGLMGTPSNTVNGPGITISGMYAALLDAIADTVVAVTPVVNGSFSFSGKDIGYYSVRITNGTPVVGSTLPIVTLPAGWAYTGEKNGTGTGTDGFADGKLYLGQQQANNTQIHFGMQQPPTAVSATAASQLNPGGTNTATVPAATFVTEDTLPGAVTSLYFSGALPTNAVKLVLNGIAYTATNPLPPAGVYVLTNTMGQPIQPVLVDPANGNVTVAIGYKAVDASGMMSASATAAVPFSKSASTNSNDKNNEGTAGVESNQDITGGSALASYRVSIYPNPTSDRVYAKADDFKNIREIKLLDIRGRELHAQKDNFQEGINMSNSVAGTYIIKVIFFNGLMKDFKVVKK